MCKVTICALVVFAIGNLILAFDGEQFAYANEPYRRSVFSGSDETDFYLNSDKEELQHPQNARKMVMVKRLSGPIVKRANYATAENSWSKYLNKISDLQILPSSEEVDGEASSPNLKMEDSLETSYGYLEELNPVRMNESYSNDMAQKWFPVLLRNANDETARNSAKKDIKPSESSTFRPWRFEDLDESMRKFVDWMVTTLHHARYTYNETESGEAPSVKQKRFDRSEEREYDNPSRCQTCVINIFNNSHIDYLVLSPNNTSSDDCIKLCSHNEIFGKSGKIDMQSLKHLGRMVDVALQTITPSTTFDSDNSLVRWDRSNDVEVTETEPSITSAMPTTTAKEITTVSPMQSISTARSKPSLKSTFNTPQAPIYPSQFYPYQPPSNPDWKAPPNAAPNQWPKYQELGYDTKKPLYSNPGKFDDRGGYDPYRDLPYDIPSAEILANSQEFEYPFPYQVNRESKKSPNSWKPPNPFKPNQADEFVLAQADDAGRLIVDVPPEYQSQEIRQDAKLRDTLSKVGLSLKSDRPLKGKQVYNQFTMSQPARSHREQGKPKMYGGAPGAPPKRTIGRKAASSTFTF